jgi:uncharacterized protein YjiS (DUF1127 family)
MVDPESSWSGGRLTRPATAVGAHLFRLAARCSDAVARHLRNRCGERQLARISDYELHDLAITRADIHRAAWQRGL